MTVPIQAGVSDQRPGRLPYIHQYSAFLKLERNFEGARKMAQSGRVFAVPEWRLEFKTTTRL